jgi:hypothetical protein
LLWKVSFYPEHIYRILTAIQGFDDNKAYCCEVLSILLQQSETNRKKFGEANGIETVLVAISVSLIHNEKNLTLSLPFTALQEA